MKVLVVGMNPSGFVRPNGQPSPTFKKLEKWMDQLGVHHFSFVNTFDEPGEIKKSKVDFQRLQTVCKHYTKVIALGGFVSEALNTVNVSHFKLPHPSPRNRLLNDKTFEKRVIKQCKEYICHGK